MQAEEKRIYVIVPQSVQIPLPRNKVRSVQMEPGRLMAQAAHVTGKMRLAQALKKYDMGKEVGSGKNQAMHYEEITTIVLAVRNSKELTKVGFELAVTASKAGYYAFHDTNPSFYGTKKTVLTAICTGPITQSEVDSTLGHLPLA